MQDSFKIAVKTKSSFNIVYRLQLPDNRVKYVNERCETTYDENSLPISSTGTLLDITERKKAEVALIKNRESMNLLVNTIPYGVQESDLEGRITFSNESHHKILGYSNNEIVGQYIWDFSIDEEKKEELINYHSYLLKEQPIPEPYVAINKTKNGREVLLEIVWNYKKDSGGKLQGFISVISDVTEKRKSERALQEAQKMEAIGQLTGGIAHDFNNILGVIIGNLDLLDAQNIDNKKANKRIAAATKATERAAKLTKQLLGFSRKKVARSSIVNINELITEMDELLEHSVGHNIEISSSLSDGLWNTEIDIGDFHDALLNMVINARDAMPDGGEIILESSNCSLEQSFCEQNAGASPGDYVMLAISDNGEGIAEDIQANIFDPFFTTKIQGKGTGLGLSMVFGFVKRSKGYIQVYSELGFGTTFRIYLPCSRNKQLEQYKDRVTEKAFTFEQLVDRNKSHATILLVDDESALLELAEQTLVNIGYNVLLAYDAMSAIEILKSHPEVALLFSDIVMPGEMNGFELAELVTIDYSNVKVILTSGYTGQAAEKIGLLTKNYSLLSKPYTQLDMATKIQSALESSGNVEPENREQNTTVEMVWSEKYCTGIPIIDEDHKVLFQLLKECQQSAVTKIQ